MISRRRCEEIARDWVISQALEEYQRRMDSLSSREPFWGDQMSEEELRRWRSDTRQEFLPLATDMMLRGGYDPPSPKIPSLWKRLHMTSWTPKDPTPDEWPMCTKKRSRDESQGSTSTER